MLRCFISTLCNLLLSYFVKGIKYPPPPPLPINHVQREHLLHEMVTKLCHSTIDPDNYGISLTVSGAGGFGKTSIVIALCHHPVVKEQFTDGVVFIELGPQATDPIMKLKGLYILLTEKQCDVNVVEQQFIQLTSAHCRNLLVIIDDVWHVEDAEPIVRAFSNCKIVLTTRMNDIEQYIPTKQIVFVGPMRQSEAISLLTNGLVDVSQLSPEDMSLLNALAEDVHLWPLLLSLIKGHLSHYLKRHQLHCREAILNIQGKLHSEGLTAFDKNNIERSRKYAVKACLDVTLSLLSKSSSDKLKTLLLWNGIGTSLQTAVLSNLWNVTQHEARDAVDVLWVFGLVNFIDLTLPPHNIIQHCVEVHTVISQYIIERMDSTEVYYLSPHGELGTSSSVGDALAQLFHSYCMGLDVSSLGAQHFLQNKLFMIEYCLLPATLRQVNMYTSVAAIIVLQGIRNSLATFPHIAIFLPSLTSEINSLVSECHKILHDTHQLCRILNQKLQRCLAQRDYKRLVQTIKTYIIEYPLSKVAQKGVTILQKVMPYCDGELLQYVMRMCEDMQMKTPDYHDITLMSLPYIKLWIKDHKKIISIIQGESPVTESFKYLLSSEQTKEMQLVQTNRLIKQQEVAPYWVQQQQGSVLLM